MILYGVLWINNHSQTILDSDKIVAELYSSSDYSKEKEELATSQSDGENFV